MGYKKMLLIIGLAILPYLLIALFIYYAYQPALDTQAFKAEDILHFPQYENQSQPNSDQGLRVVTYNMGYGSGEKNNTPAPLSVEEHGGNLKAMADYLRDLNPHIILLQEVDFFARRSFDTNHMEYLIHQLKMPYAAYTVTWNKKFIPFPFWPPFRQYGRLVSGQAVLSRLPIQKQKVLTFPKPDENYFWYNWFYIDRAAQQLTLSWNNQPLSIYNVHLEAFRAAARRQQLAKLAKMVLADPLSQKIVGGDFNFVWDHSHPVKEKWKDERESLENFSKKTGLEMVGKDDGLFSFPSWDPYFILDYLFYSPSLRALKTGIPKELVASDHLPRWALFEKAVKPDLSEASSPEHP